MMDDFTLSILKSSTQLKTNGFLSRQTHAKCPAVK